MRDLTAVGIKAAADGKLFDGGGLMLVKAGVTGKWVYRYSHLGRRREMGLGTWPTVSLAEARKTRDAWAVELAAGRDPVTIRDAERNALKAGRDREDPTFTTLTDKVFEARKATLRGEGTRGRWRSPLEVHFEPQIGRINGSELTADNIVTAIRPIWRKMHPTATKCVERTRIVLREARLMGYPTDPFIVDRAVSILGAVRHVKTPIEATPWKDLPAVYAALPSGAVGDCLRLVMLTVVRVTAAQGARPEERASDVWTVPKDRVKGTEKDVQDFRVPLSSEARRVWDRAAATGEPYLFQSYTGRPVTLEALEKAYKKRAAVGLPHGLRTSFRTWAQDHDKAWDAAEVSLGHVIGNKTERSYARSDLLERRRVLMEEWAGFVTETSAAP